MFKNELQRLLSENNLRTDEEKRQAWIKYRDAMNTVGSNARLESINKTYSDEIIEIDKRYEDTKKAIHAENAEKEKQLANKQSIDKSCEELNQPNIGGAVTEGLLKGLIKDALDPHPPSTSSSMFDKPIEEALLSVSKEFVKAKQKQEECERQKIMERTINRTVDPLTAEALNDAFDPLGVFTHTKKQASPLEAAEPTSTSNTTARPIFEASERERTTP